MHVQYSRFYFLFIFSDLNMPLPYCHVNLREIHLNPGLLSLECLDGIEEIQQI